MDGDDLAVWLQRILETMGQARAWFRRGLTAEELSQRSGLPLPHVFAALRAASARGYLQVVDRVPGRGTVHALTPRGVAAYRLLPAAEEPGDEDEVPEESSR